MRKAAFWVGIFRIPGGDRSKAIAANKLCPALFRLLGWSLTFLGRFSSMQMCTFMFLKLVFRKGFVIHITTLKQWWETFLKSIVEVIDLFLHPTIELSKTPN